MESELHDFELEFREAAESLVVPPQPAAALDLRSGPGNQLELNLGVAKQSPSEDAGGEAFEQHVNKGDVEVLPDLEICGRRVDLCVIPLDPPRSLGQCRFR